MTTQEVRSARLNMRLTPEARRDITTAAMMSGQDLTSFVIGSALDRARRVILEESLIKLSDRDFEDLKRAIDAPEERSERLAQVLQRVR